jgi:uncharacterized protein YbaR (Trm112 family)
MAAAISLVCPHCKKRLQAPPGTVGKVLACPSCRKPVAIAAASNVQRTVSAQRSQQSPTVAPVAGEGGKSHLVRNVGIAAGAISLAFVAAIVVPELMRDKWEANNAGRVSARLDEADRLQQSDPLGAYKAYDEVLHETQQHKIAGEELSRKLAAAENSKTALYPKVQEKIRAEEAEKQRVAAEEAKRVAAEKQRRAGEEAKLAAAETQRAAEQQERKRAAEIAASRPEVPKANTDPVGAIKELLTVIERDGTQPRVVEVKGKGRWLKRHYAARHLKYDVQKTESLVSPYAATVTWSVDFYDTEERATKQEAEADAVPKEPTSKASRSNWWWAKFAWQEGKWVLQDIGCDIGDLHYSHSDRNPPSPIHDWWRAFGGASDLRAEEDQ